LLENLKNYPRLYIITCHLWAARVFIAVIDIHVKQLVTLQILVFNYYSKFYTFAESTVRNCEPCGTNLIPYPLSTGPNCGERMYFSFDCNSSTGQVSFKAPSGTFRVASIDPSNRTFVIQVKHVGYNRNSSGPTQLLNDSLPFIESTWQVTNSNDSSGIEAEVHISWDFPKEPSCNSSRDCKDWPYSTCKKARDEMRRCLCKLHFQWNGSTLNCTRG